MLPRCSNNIGLRLWWHCMTWQDPPFPVKALWILENFQTQTTNLEWLKKKTKQFLRILYIHDRVQGIMTCVGGARAGVHSGKSMDGKCGLSRVGNVHPYYASTPAQDAAANWHQGRRHVWVALLQAWRDDGGSQISERQIMAHGRWNSDYVSNYIYLTARDEEAWGAVGGVHKKRSSAARWSAGWECA